MRKVNSFAAAFLVAALAVLVAPAGFTSAATPKCNGKTATIVGTGVNPINGTSGPDVIVGTNGDDTIFGLGGDDTICGLGGNNRISGSEDNDTIFGGDFVDTIEGGPGNDTVYGGDGNDSIFDVEATGDDTYYGGDGDDDIFDVGGKNIAKGGSGNDVIVLTGKAYGEAGDDAAVQAQETSSGAGDAIADGGSGSDGFGRISGFSFVQGVWVTGGVAIGGSGDDRIAIFANGDTAEGGSGSDFINASIGTGQLVDCGSAYDYYLTDGSDTIRRCEGIGDPNS